MALPDNGLFGAIAGKKSLPTIEVAPARHSEGSPARCRAARACHARARGDIDVNPVPDLNTATALEHDPEKVGTGFPKRSCSNKKIERDDDSKKSHHALAVRLYPAASPAPSAPSFCAGLELPIPNRCYWIRAPLLAPQSLFPQMASPSRIPLD
jgi:hypothetical protein